MTLFNNGLYASIIDYDFFFLTGYLQGEEGGEKKKLFHLNLSVLDTAEEIINQTIIPNSSRENALF